MKDANRLKDIADRKPLSTYDHILSLCRVEADKGRYEKFISQAVPFDMDTHNRLLAEGFFISGAIYAEDDHRYTISWERYK